MIPPRSPLPFSHHFSRISIGALSFSPFPLPGSPCHLAPADVKKERSAYDLPIALGMLASSGQVREDLLSDFIILGELALDGSLRPIHGALPIAVEVRKIGIRGIILPEENAQEAAMVEGVDVYGVESRPYQEFQREDRKKT